MLNNWVIEDEVRWWLQDRSRCKTYGKHILSMNNEEDMEKRLKSSMFDLPNDADEYH